jgi:hypothetical protein
MTDATRTPAESTNRSTRRRARRRHAAPLTRIVVGGLSLSAACALMTGMALATKNADTQSTDPQPVTLDQTTATTVDPSATTVTTAGPSVTIVVRHHPAPDAGASTAGSAPSPPAASPW